LRTLKFIVDGQIIKPDPSCNFDDLVPGTERYLQAQFTFSPEWSGYARVASFWSALGKEYMPQVIKNDFCLIPTDALKKRVFKVQVIGQLPNGLKIKTNKLAICQNGGK
jgi:hypothetical protein